MKKFLYLCYLWRFCCRPPAAGKRVLDVKVIQAPTQVGDDRRRTGCGYTPPPSSICEHFRLKWCCSKVFLYIEHITSEVVLLFMIVLQL